LEDEWTILENPEELEIVKDEPEIDTWSSVLEDTPQVSDQSFTTTITTTTTTSFISNLSADAPEFMPSSRVTKHSQIHPDAPEFTPSYKRTTMPNPDEIEEFTPSYRKQKPDINTDFINKERINASVIQPAENTTKSKAEMIKKTEKSKEKDSKQKIKTKKVKEPTEKIPVIEPVTTEIQTEITPTSPQKEVITPGPPVSVWQMAKGSDGKTYAEVLFSESQNKKDFVEAINESENITIVQTDQIEQPLDTVKIEIPQIAETTKPEETKEKKNKKDKKRQKAQKD